MKDMKTIAKRRAAQVAAILVGLALTADKLPAANVLFNSGFETGNANGWTAYINGGANANPQGSGILSAGTIVAGSTTKAYVAHSGTFFALDYGQYSGPPNQSGLYQDVITTPGSVWSADGWVNTQTPFNIVSDPSLGTNQFWLQVAFLDAGNNTLALYKSAIITTANLTPDTWVDLQITNQIDLTDPNLMNVIGTSATMTAPAGTVKVRYQSFFTQVAGYAVGGSVTYDDLTLNKLAPGDPDIATFPASQTVVAGHNATFTVVATGNSTLHYQWSANSVNLSNSSKYAGATGAALIISNVTPADAGVYGITVSDTSGAIAATAKLKVVTTAQLATNLLINPGFEDGVESEPWENAWVRFNGGNLVTANYYYYLSSTPVSILDGTYASESFAVAQDNGIYQDVPASAGQAFSANGNFYSSSLDPLMGGNYCVVQIQFFDNGGNLSGVYESETINTNAIMSSQFPQDTWVNLPVTNIIAFWSDWSVVGTTNLLVAPPNTVKVRYLVYYFGAGGSGAIYYDNMQLRAVNSVTLSAVQSSVSINISFASQLGSSYQVLYKNALTDSTWNLLETVSGTGGTITKSYPATGTRFYRVSTQ